MGSRVTRRGLLVTALGAVPASAGYRRILRGHPGAITALSWSPDGKRLASATDSREPVSLWQPENPTARPFNLEGASFSVAWSPDGRRLALRDTGADVVAVWTIPGLRQEISVNSNSWLSGPHPAWNTGANLLAVSGDCFDFGVLDVDRKQMLWRWKSEDRTHTFTWSPDGRILAAAGGNGGLRLVNGLTGEVLYRLREPAREPYEAIHVGAAWSPDGEWLAVSGPQDGTIRLWEMAFRREGRILEFPADLPNCFAWRPGMDQLAVTAGDTVWLLDLAKGTRRKLAGPTGVYTELAWHPHGKVLAIGKRDGSILLLEASK